MTYIPNPNVDKGPPSMRCNVCGGRASHLYDGHFPEFWVALSLNLSDSEHVFADALRRDCDGAYKGELVDCWKFYPTLNARQLGSPEDTNTNTKKVTFYEHRNRGGKVKGQSRSDAVQSCQDQY